MANNDKRWMKLALNLGARGLGQVAPNPAVGCVIVKNGRLLGRGWTQPGGRPHAETMALAQAGKAARGATAYVTLEPCSHHGKTPPCSEALLAAGIRRVVCPMLDPDPRVSGRGFAMLFNAGVQVDRHGMGELKQAAHEANKGFLLKVLKNRPMLTLKLATSLDGRIATETGESRWITGPESRRYVHHLRATHDAVLIGRGTAEADNPMLDIRDLGLSHHNPVRVVVDSQLSLSPDSRLAQSARDIPLWICHGNASPEKRAKWSEIGAKLIEVKTAENGLDMADMMIKLAEEGLTRVLCEGGGQLAASLIKEQLVDRLEVFNAGLLLGANGTPSIGPLEFESLADFPRFKQLETRSLGDDTLSIWEPDTHWSQLPNLKKKKLEVVNIPKFTIEVLK